MNVQRKKSIFKEKLERSNPYFIMISFDFHNFVAYDFSNCFANDQTRSEEHNNTDNYNNI